MSGEWLRMRCRAVADHRRGARPLDRRCSSPVAEGVGFDLDLGMYLERGLPNCLRPVHPCPPHRPAAARLRTVATRAAASFLTAGLRRSLAIQLSDGSVASGYRSTGQTWVLGAQIALFMLSRTTGAGDCDRPGGSPERGLARLSVAGSTGGGTGERVLPGAELRCPPSCGCGYERYTADGHYSPLALGFLATAVRRRVRRRSAPSSARELDVRPAEVRAEGAPVHRGVAHRGRISVAVQAQADETYDATGLVDLTFGAGRLLHFVSAARHVSGGPWLVPGLALRERAGASPVTAVGGRQHAVTELAGADGGLHFTSVLSPTDDATQLAYRFEATVTDRGVEVAESTPGRSGHVSLLLPYLRDLGSGLQTRPRSPIRACGSLWATSGWSLPSRGKSNGRPTSRTATKVGVESAGWSGSTCESRLRCCAGRWSVRRHDRRDRSQPMRANSSPHRPGSRVTAGIGRTLISCSPGSLASSGRPSDALDAQASSSGAASGARPAPTPASPRPRSPHGSAARRTRWSAASLHRPEGAWCCQADRRP